MERAQITLRSGRLVTSGLEARPSSFGSKGRNPLSKRPEKEHRRWPRLAITIPVFLRGSDERRKEFVEFGSILNISAGGILFASRKVIPVRSRIILEIPTGQPSLAPKMRSPNKFEVRILRSVPMNGLYGYAARFKSPLGPLNVAT
jgi:hypothetical protein